MRVQEVMTRKVETIAPEESAEAALQRMRVEQDSSSGRAATAMKVVGIVSDRDVGQARDRHGSGT